MIAVFLSFLFFPIASPNPLLRALSHLLSLGLFPRPRAWDA